MKKYVKLTQTEHILLRPDTYVGAVENTTEAAWVVEDDGTMRKRDVTYSPALMKLFDEILVNAADSHDRDRSMRTLKVDVDSRRATVWNDGAAIPVKPHDTEPCHVPELIFGHLLTGENYDDSQRRTCGGRNGYGAKLVNVFSEKFEIDVCDGSKRYVQTWERNMTEKREPKITKCSKKPYVQVSFWPDFARFGCSEFEPDVLALMRRRTHDVAAVLGKAVRVQWCGTRISSSFREYVRAFAPSAVCAEDVAVSPNDEFDHVSFVNAVATARGGTHVNAIADAVAKAVVDAAAKKKIAIKPAVARSKMFVFVNARVVNPTFDTQSKDYLTTRNHGVAADPAFVKKAAAALMDAVLAEASARACVADSKALKKTDGCKRARVTGIPKLTDANWAGTEKSGRCTLILTEGDSAKSLAIAGLGVAGRDAYGVFPLRGKLLNVRDAPAATIANNAEISALKKILGLQTGKTYADASSLRYGHVMVMTDADVDGSHIAGLVMNFFHSCFPGLLTVPDFFKGFVTPIVKATRGKLEKSFYSLPEFEAWKSETADRGAWRIKYYKGLGTSSAAEAKEYFSNPERHVKTYRWTPEASEAIDRSFSKARAGDRKAWISAHVPGTHLDPSARDVPLVDFVDRELVLFSRADVERSVPSVVDGLKPSQRKVLFAAFKRKLATDVKVAQFAGYVAEHTAYHHGEASLIGTIVGMAQDFVGSNNANYLVPSGQFGTRLMGGKDAASARYIFTRLSPATRTLFHPDDDASLDYLDDDGESIEPRWYVPVLPTLLINGSSGIGTGWSTEVPAYDPAEVAANVERMIRGQDPLPMTPWYRGFAGTIERVADDAFVTRGVWSARGKTVTITELPVGRWTQDVKDHLESLLDRKIVTDYRENHTDATVRFDVEFSELPSDIAGVLKLENTVRTSNMHAFDADGKIAKYASPEDVLRAWFEVRKRAYLARKTRMLAELDDRARAATAKSRFVDAVASGDLRISGRPGDEVVADVRRLIPDGDASALLGMDIRSLTAERAEKLREEAAALIRARDELLRTEIEDLWIRDIRAAGFAMT